uniref:Uncharacterized protein n=1 Tax=viral metagenome TaxID=1070528 RepID=A0A6C0KLE0_9ZZZZ
MAVLSKPVANAADVITAIFAAEIFAHAVAVNFCTTAADNSEKWVLVKCEASALNKSAP